jgi:hypothetical protein
MATLSGVAGAPLEPYPDDPIPPEEFDQDRSDVVEMEQEHRKATERWMEQINGLRRQNARLKQELSLKQSLVDNLGAGLKGIVALVILCATLASIAWGWFVKKEVARSVLSAVVGGLCLFVWLYFFQQIIFIGLIVAGAVLVFFGWKAFKGSQAQTWLVGLIEGIQHARVKNPEIKPVLDPELQGTVRDSDRELFVAKVKAKKGLASLG